MESVIREVEFSLSEKAYTELSELKERLKVPSHGDVLCLALGTLLWVVDELEHGNQILVQRQPGKAVALAFPHLKIQTGTEILKARATSAVA